MICSCLGEPIAYCSHMCLCVCIWVCVFGFQTGQNKSLQQLYGFELSDEVKSVLRRNRGIQAVKEIRVCQQATLDLSGRNLGEEGVTELAFELKVFLL